MEKAAKNASSSFRLTAAKSDASKLGSTWIVSSGRAPELLIRA